MDSDAMRQFLKEQRDLFDFIILDCPPALVVADALALAPLADAVLVVADAKESDRDLVSRLKEEIEQVGGKIVGAVLNRSKQASKNTYYETQDEGAGQPSNHNYVVRSPGAHYVLWPCGYLRCVTRLLQPPHVSGPGRENQPGADAPAELDSGVVTGAAAA